MNFDPCNSQICLTENRPLRLLSARGVRITCTAGIAWLTVAGESGDILLTAGESHRVRSNGLALVEAIGTARVQLEQPLRGWQTLWRVVRGCWQRRPLLLPRSAGSPWPLWRAGPAKAG
ncbi:DUF2917 domain-containing protein [Accumulibacter sp.]|uniref:DUF2917 domain-containing protein n=1 Tax=Accumulibacter sp. TaxID=2053492 RepID=UPI0025F1198C|nr:DUF2917 domain-containing protein [Accumulibacter sp.]MCM8610755.1 DUF2917 domain-containing protein [Accumulibacter sp.]MCM8635253.1 DUF2917 domain-containing protein [Accumulibacter sp.]MCM8638594.1 DUF2917 domain-containing protein [Accumulibacter sp.]